MPTQTERRERQDGMFMPKAALALLMAVIRQDVTRVTCLADADRLRVHNIYLFTSVCYRIVLKKMGAERLLAHRYVRTADVIEAHAVGGRGLHIFQCNGTRLGKTQ